MKKISLVLLLLIGYNKSVSQNVNLDSQDDVNNFSINYPGVHSFSSISITGADITNLNSLSQVTEVTGDLYIYSPGDNHPLADISGLNNVTIIDGRLSLVDLKNINAINLFPNLLKIGSGNFGNGLSISGLTPATISGFNILANVSGDIAIQNTSELINLNGFDSLTKVKAILFNSQASLYFIDNSALSSINGFSNLNEIAWEYYFVNNPNLVSLPNTPNLTVIGKSITLLEDDTIINFNGLNSLTTLGGSINVKDNNALVGFFGLNNLTVANGIDIQNNPVMSSLTDLANLVTFPFVGPTRPSINISNNNTLSSLTGLDNINGATIGAVVLQNNPNLSLCAIDSFCEKIAFDTHLLDFTQVNNNATNCNSADDINIFCQLLNTNEINSDYLISIHPNPVKSILNLSTSSPTQIIISDVLGRIRIKTLVANGTIDLSDFEKGVYFLQASFNNKISYLKLIKE
jgi:hypothetical protein